MKLIDLLQLLIFADGIGSWCNCTVQILIFSRLCRWWFNVSGIWRNVLYRKDRILEWNLGIRAAECVRARTCVRASEWHGDRRRPSSIDNNYDIFCWQPVVGVIPFITSAFGSRSNLVGTATALLAGRSGAEIPVVWRHFSPLQNIQTGSGASLASGWIDTAILPRGAKTAGAWS